jgi:hypothetical protein
VQLAIRSRFRPTRTTTYATSACKADRRAWPAVYPQRFHKGARLAWHHVHARISPHRAVLWLTPFLRDQVLLKQ